MHRVLCKQGKESEGREEAGEAMEVEEKEVVDERDGSLEETVGRSNYMNSIYFCIPSNDVTRRSVCQTAVVVW